MSDRLPGIARVVSHVVVWVCLLAPVAADLTKGWAPIGDNAAIAARAWQVFTLHPPLVGMFTTAAARGHVLYDPGPLLFWLMAVPVRVDPLHGVLWGPAVVAGIVLSLAIEAVWRTRMWIGCTVIAFVMVDLLWLTPEVLENLVWNAYFPVPFFIATVALAWVVARGGWGWWPLLVFTASVAAQSHLIFAFPSVALALAAPLVGLALSGRPPRWRWVVAGVGVGVVCWLAPILQNFGSHGNLAALLSNGRGQKTYGLSYALHLLSAANSPKPIWFTSQPSDLYQIGVLIGNNSSWLGLLSLVLLAVIAAVAWRVGRRQLCALAVVDLVASIGMLAAFAIFPVRDFQNIEYLIIGLWVLGILFWTTVAWSVLVTGASLVRRRRGVVGPGVDGPDEGQLSARSTGWLFTGALAMVGVVGLAGLSALPSFKPSLNSSGWEPTAATIIANGAATVERTVPRRQDVTVEVAPDPSSGFGSLWESEGLAYRLQVDGWKPGLTGVGRAFTFLEPGRHSVTVQVNPEGTRVVSVTGG